MCYYRISALRALKLYTYVCARQQKLGSKKRTFHDMASVGYMSRKAKICKNDLCIIAGSR